MDRRASPEGPATGQQSATGRSTKSQNIRFPTASTKSPSKIPATTAMRNQGRKRGPEVGSASMCWDRSGGKECDRGRLAACGMDEILRRSQIVGWLCTVKVNIARLRYLKS